MTNNAAELGVLINKGCISDWQEYKKIRLRALKEVPQAFRNSYEEAELLTEKEWQGRLDDPNSSILLVRKNGNLIGMGGINFSPLKKIKHIAKLFEFYIKPEYNGQGIGSQLMEAIIGEAKNHPGIVKIQLYVNKECNKAVGLYKKFGFEQVGILEKELKVDDQFIDEYLMEKEMND